MAREKTIGLGWGDSGVCLSGWPGELQFFIKETFLGYFRNMALIISLRRRENL